MLGRHRRYDRCGSTYILANGRDDTPAVFEFPYPVSSLPLILASHLKASKTVLTETAINWHLLSQGDHSTSIFSCGGYIGLPGVGLTCSKDLLHFDARAKAWQSKASLPDAKGKHGIAACSGRLYVIGGSTMVSGPVTGEKPTGTCHCYDVRAGRWTEAEEPMPLPRPLESLAAVAVGGQVGA